jgi:hypothetical protein
MFNVSIREYFSVLNVFIVCICNTAVFKLIPLLCTHVYSYMFSTVHPPRVAHIGLSIYIKGPRHTRAWGPWPVIYIYFVIGQEAGYGPSSLYTRL